MASYNKVIMMGHLTRDPELKYLPSQTAVVEFGIATNYKYGEKEEVCFVDCQAFGKQAETIDKYFNKGRAILIEGRLTFDQWEAQDGSKRSKHRVTVDRFTFVDSGKDNEAGNGRQANDAPPASVPQGRPALLPEDSDVPF